MTLDVGTERLNPLSHTSFEVLVDGRSLSAGELADLLDVRVQRGVRTVGRAQLVFADRAFALVTSRLAIGAAVVVRAGGTDLFTGTATALGTSVGAGGTTTTLTAHDAAHALTTEASVVARANVSVASIVTELASPLSVKGWPGGGAVEEWHLQADTPLGLIDELALAAGLDWVVDGRTLHVWKRANATGGHAGRTPTLSVGAELAELSARQVGVPDATYVVQGWDAAGSRSVRATADAPRPRAGFSARVAGGGGRPRIQVGGLQVRSSAEAETRAQALAARHGRVEAHGHGYLMPDVVPGGEVVVRDGGPLDGTYYVQEVEHRFDGRTTRTSFVAGDREPVRLGTGASRSASSLRHDGIVVATVNRTDDPDKAGRVMVTYVTASDQASSHWARVLAPGGGPSGGLVLQHEPGDEVLVAFEGGDVTRPVVLGGLHSAQAAVPPHVGDDVRVRGLRSRTGQVLLLGDGTDDGAYVELGLAVEGHRLRISQRGAALEVGDIPLRISAGSSQIELDGKGKVVVRGTDVTVEATNELRLQGTTVKIAGKTAVEVTGTQVAVKANATAELSASGTTKIAGGMVAIN